MPSKVYVDSSIFLGWLQGKTSTVNRTQGFLNQVTRGFFNAVTSTVALSEVIKVIRKNQVANGVYNSNQWDVKERNALRAIFSIKGLSVLKGEPYETLHAPSLMTFGKISSASLALVKKYPGSVGRNYKTGIKEHDGIGTADAFHIVLAKRFDCDMLATLDNDFNETRNEITPLVI